MKNLHCKKVERLDGDAFKDKPFFLIVLSAAYECAISWWRAGGEQGSIDYIRITGFCSKRDRRKGYVTYS